MLAAGGRSDQLRAQPDSARTTTLVCESRAGHRRTCATNTRATIRLVRSVGPVPCDTGRSWGHDARGIWVANGCTGEFAVMIPPRKTFGSYEPLIGFKLVDTDGGDAILKIYAYTRYLNQLSLDDRYIDAFNDTTRLRLRQDIFFQKVLIHFLGWFVNERFRYHTYAWTTNTSQGLAAQVVIAGELNYDFSQHFTLGGGTASLPGVRATEGNFPLWLTVDNRLIADEFFRPSYTFGVWIKGHIVEGLNYESMLANNLSQLGIDAGQLDHGLNTWSSMLVWMPTTKEYGPLGGYGDYEHHERLATRIGLHYTRSDESAQPEPNSDAFDNVQVRLSDGNIIFRPNLFGDSITVTQVAYHMGSVDAGAKYRGFSLEGEHYWRGLNHYHGPGTFGLPDLWDHGFQAQASAMVVAKRFQAYLAGSKVYGKFGDPWDQRVGVNWFPLATRTVRWNLEYLRLHRSPVGALSLPYIVGGNGPVIYSSFEINF
jgi:Protein of unknown function (DUF3011)